MNFILERLTPLSHSASVAKIKSDRGRKPLFEPAQLAGSGFWCVQIALPNGDETQIYDFRTKEEAETWIANESASWVKGYKGGRYS